MKTAAATVFFLTSVLAGADKPLLWRDPGPVESLDLAGGPTGLQHAPKPPFRFVKEEGRGISPKVVVTDARAAKWMVKFGEEAKPENFASRLAWAAGYVVRPTYYVPEGRIEGLSSLGRAHGFIDATGAFRGARFQMFDNEDLHQVDDERLDLMDRGYDQRQLNGLKLTLLLVANWDVKPANTAVMETGGNRYATVIDWGASLGDPLATNPPGRKWNCQGFRARTAKLIDGVENGFVVFNYGQYAARNVEAISANIRVDDLKWFVDRMSKLRNGQLRAALLASGATEADASCFTTAIQERLGLFKTVAETGGTQGVSRTRTVTKTVTKTTTDQQQK